MAPQAAADDRKVRDAVQKVIDGLISFDDETRQRILRTVATFFDFGGGVAEGPRRLSEDAGRPSFSENREMSPKEFLFQKKPKTDVERVACLAYYLAHYRDTPHIKTIDVSKLNTEAAQVKFSNTAYAVANASKSGLLVPAGKGAKQISAIGERFVEALPDHSAAKAVKSTMSTRRSRSRSGSKK